MLAVVAPGQGAQSPAVLAAWSGSTAVRECLASAGAVVGTDLERLGRSGSPEALTATTVAQPVLVALGLGAWRELDALLPGVRADLLAGHSVGELTVAAVGGALDEPSAYAVVGARATAMADAIARPPVHHSAHSSAQPPPWEETGLLAVTAVLRGGPAELARGEAELAARLLDRAAAYDVSLAHRNGGGQVVLGGPVAHLDALVADLEGDPLPRTRLARLPVAGAFHTPAMAAAVEPLRRALATTGAAGPTTARFVRGIDGAVVDGATLVAGLPDGVTAAVRWDLVVDTLAAAGVTGVLELPPAGTLVGLLRRARPDLATYALAGPDDLAGARAFCVEHAPAAPRP